MGMFKNVKHWLHGLLAAIIGGGSSAVCAAVGPMMIDREVFNLQDGIGNVLKTMLAGFIVSGLLQAAGYLKQSPIPPEDEDTSFFGKPQNAKPNENDNPANTDS